MAVASADPWRPIVSRRSCRAPGADCRAARGPRSRRWRRRSARQWADRGRSSAPAVRLLLT